MTEWKTEQADPADAGELTALYHSVFSELAEHLPERLVQARLASADRVKDSIHEKMYFIVRHEGRIAGVARASIVHDACLLDRMVVSADLRSKGIGASLVERVLQYAVDMDANKVFLDTSVQMTRTRQFYESLGFVQCGIFRKHYWGDDIVFYEKLLK